MPLDNCFNDIDSYLPNRYEVWESKFAWFPERCTLTGKFIWLKFGIRGAIKFRTDMDIRYRYRWHDPKDHLIWVLSR